MSELAKFLDRYKQSFTVKCERYFLQEHEETFKEMGEICLEN